MFSTWTQAPVVQRVDSTFDWISHYPPDNSIGSDGSYPVDCDLSTACTTLSNLSATESRRTKELVSKELAALRLLGG